MGWWGPISPLGPIFPLGAIISTVRRRRRWWVGVWRIIAVGWSTRWKRRAWGGL